MLSLLKNRSIKLQLLFAGGISLVIMVSIVFITYIQTSGVIFNKNSDYTEEIMEKMEKDISTELESINKIVSAMAYSEVIQDYLISDDISTKFELYPQVDKVVNNMTNLSDSIADIIIISSSGKGYNTAFDPEEKATIDGFTKRIPFLTKAYYSEFEKWDLGYKKIDCLLVGTKIYALDSNKPNYGEIVGELILVIDAAVFSKQINGMSQKVAGNFYILDKVGKVYNGQSSEENKEEIDIIRRINDIGNLKKKNYIVHTKDLSAIGGKIISVYNKSVLFKGLNDVRRLDINILIISVVLLFILYYIIGCNIIRPIQNFVSFIDSIRDGNLKNLKKIVLLEGYKEIGIVSNAFNNLLNSIDNLAHRILNMNSRLYEAELAKKQAELEFLKSQINPHFLHNTLETINGMAVLNGNYDVRDMINNLSDILWYSIKGNDQVFLHEEINIVKAYVQIQKMRFRRRFEEVYEFSEDVLNVKIIKMVIQPIVENAITHGVEPRLNKSIIRIGGCIDEDGNVVLWVKDNGVGMDDTTLEEIRKELLSESGEEPLRKIGKSHIGIANVNWRLKITYGDEFGITVESKLGWGTEIYFKIPGEG